MDVTMAQDDLQQAAQVMQNIVNQTTSLHILRNVLIDVNDNGDATLMASDLEAYARVNISAKSCKKGGRSTLPARTFAELVKELPAATDVHLKIKGNQATIDAEGIDYELATMPADDFPDWPDFEPKSGFVIAQSVLREALQKLRSAIPARDPRKVLLGALFDLKKEGLNLVATDGKKLIKLLVPVEDVEGAKEHRGIVPKKIVEEIVGQLDEAGTVKVQFGERQVAFDTGKVLYVANTIEGEFPQYDLVIPKAFEREAKMARDPLMADLRRASIVQDRNEYGITLTFTGDKLKISARGHEVGKFEGLMDADFSGPDGDKEFPIVFNYSFLQDLLKAAGGDNLTMKMNSSGTPAIIVPENGEDDTYLLMPIKTTDYQDAYDDDDDDDDEEDYDDE